MISKKIGYFSIIAFAILCVGLNSFAMNELISKFDGQEGVIWKTNICPDYKNMYASEQDALKDFESYSNQKFDNMQDNVDLSYFIKIGDYEAILKKLDNKGFDINKESAIVKMTPLNYAISIEDFAMVKFLAKNEAKFDYKSLDLFELKNKSKKSFELENDFENKEIDYVSLVKQFKDDEEYAKYLQEQESFVGEENRFENNNQDVKKEVNNKDENKKEVEVKKECPLCLCEMDCKDNNNKLLALPCGHVFHEECINPWLEGHDTCPNCREKIIK